MKKLMYFLLFFLTLFACDNRGFDGKIQEHFPFEFEATTLQSYFVGSIGQINLEISNEHEYQNQKYTVAYEVTGGDGEFFFRGESVKNEITLTKGKAILDFKPLKTGNYKIVFTAKNGEEKYNKIKEVSINVINKPFEPTVTAEENIFVSENGQVEVKIKVDDPNWVTYKWSWTSKQINSLEKTDGSSIAKETTQDIAPNKEERFVFKANQKKEEHILFFTFEDTQGQKIKLDLRINLKNINFEAVLTAKQKEIFFYETNNLDFSLKPEFVSKTNPNSYKVKFILDGGDGYLLRNGKKINHFDEFEINQAEVEKETFVFVPTKYSSNVTVTFQIEDRYDFKKEVSTSFNVKNEEYEFFAKKLSEKPLIPNEQTVDISLELKTKADFKKMKYELRLVSDSRDEARGYFTYRGQRIEYNDDFILSDPLDKITYHPTAFGSGKHQISFQVKDITGQTPKNSVNSISVDIYKEMKLKYLTLDRTWEKDWRGQLKKPHYRMEYFISYELEEPVKLKSVRIKGYDKRDNKSFDEKPLEESDAKNQINNKQFKLIDWETNPQDVFEPGDELEVIFTDINDKELKVKTKMKEKK